MLHASHSHTAWFILPITLGWVPMSLFVQPLFPMDSLPHLPPGYGFPRTMDSNHHVGSAWIRITWKGVSLIKTMSFLALYRSLLPLPQTSNKVSLS